MNKWTMDVNFRHDRLKKNHPAFKLDNTEYLKALYDLMKPRVMSLAIFTCVVGFLIAPFKSIDYLYAILSITAVALGSGAAGALNCWYEADVDSIMSRTCLRPIPTGKLTKKQALIFGTISSFISVGALYLSLIHISEPTRPY